MAKQIILLLAVVSCAVQNARADEGTLKADFRPRPPEMYNDKKTGKPTGPLIDVLDEAAKAIGYRVAWRSDAQFPRSLEDLKTGATDLVPRFILTAERKQYAEYLGPISAETKRISFLVKKGREDLIQSYDDLKKITTGVKRGTVYFERFDQDSSLKERKKESSDDANLARMFIAGRFDAMIVLDKEPIEKTLKELQFADYAYARYAESVTLENYYGFSKKSPHFGIASKLNEVLANMAKSGRVRAIYENYGISTPSK